MDAPDEDPRPLRVEIVGGPGVASESPRSRLRRDVLPIVLSVVLSGAVALGVARYTVENNDRIQRGVGVQQKLSAAYLPLLSTLSNVVACVAPNLCSESQLLRASRAANTATLAALGQGSATVDDLADAVMKTLGAVVRHRLQGKRPSTALVTRASRQFAALQIQISKELDP